MSTIDEIEAAIENLPIAQVEELSRWLDGFRAQRAVQPPVENWLDRARGTALPGATTATVMALTRGDE